MKIPANGFTHAGKFHADDVFATALLQILRPDIKITRGFTVPDDFDGIVYDIGFGMFDHHQEPREYRANGVPYAAFGLLWEKLGPEILGEELALKFDESFVQPLDNNDNTGEKNELASLIGNFNPTWDAEGSNDEAFFQAVSVAGMILENKFDRYRGNERADKRVEEIYERHILLCFVRDWVNLWLKLSRTNRYRECTFRAKAATSDQMKSWAATLISLGK